MSNEIYVKGRFDDYHVGLVQRITKENLSEDRLQGGIFSMAWLDVQRYLLKLYHDVYVLIQFTV